MEISNEKLNRNINNNNVLPSLFGNHVVAKDGSMAINDSSLTQQIEFILQDATMTDNDMEQQPQKEQEQQEADDNNPPNIHSNSNSTCATEHNEQPQINSNSLETTANRISIVEAQLLSERGIIIQPTRTVQQQNVQQVEDEEDEVEDILDHIVDEDPELNDENLQDIEAETQESEAELQQVDEHYPRIARIKLEQYDNELQQLVLPSGTIVRTTSNTATLPALTTLQRRPVYIAEVPNSTSLNIDNLPNTTTIINMRNVVNVVGANGNSIQLPNATPTAIGTSVVVTSASHVLPPGVSIVPLSNVTSAQIFNNTTLASLAQAKKPTTKKSSKKPNTNSNKIQASTANSSSTTMDGNTKYIGTLLCSDCPERFDSKELFDIHRSGHLNNMKCAICNMVLKSLKNYEKHCLRCKPYECQICGRVVRFRPNFIKHMRVHTACQAAERHKYKCEVCHKEFMSFEYFKVHKKIHSENVNLTCEICGKVFSALASLRGHSKLHSGNKLHKCDVCGKGFGQRYNLKIHARTHTGEFPFECSLCHKKVHTEKALESHMKIHQRTDENNATSRNRNIKKSKSHITRPNAAMENNLRYERPSTSGLQQLCAIASDNLKNFNNQIDSTTINDTTEGEIFNSNDSQDPIQDDNDNDNDDLDIHNNVMNNDEDDDDDNEHRTSIRAPARTIVINNFVQNKTNNNESNVNSVPTSKAIGVIIQSSQHQQQHHTQVIQSCGNISNGINNNNDSVLKQQLMRQTPIIQTASSAYILQNKGTSTSHTLPTSAAMVITRNNFIVGTPTICTVGQPNQYASAAALTTSATTTSNLGCNDRNLHINPPETSNNHRQQQEVQHHHRSPDRDISLDVDDDAHVMDAHDMVHQTTDGNSCNSVMANDNATIMTMTHQVPTILHSRKRNGDHFDDDSNDDDKSSPSLATTAIIKQEPNFYSSGSADNSNEMLIKEEVIFDDSQNNHSPRTHSSLSSKFCMSNFDTDHHGPMDLNHTLPPYGHLFESHSIPDSIPFARMDDEDFQLDQSSLGGLHNTSNSTTDGEFMKKEWVYGPDNNFHMSGKFDEDTEPMCEPASFIYN